MSSRKGRDRSPHDDGGSGKRRDAGSAAHAVGNVQSDTSHPECDDKHGHYVIKLGEAIGENNRYKMLDILGEGTFGKVVECFDRVERTRLAVKIIKAIPKYRHAAKIELRVLKRLHADDEESVHCCVKLLGSIDFKNHICMMFEKLGLSIYDHMVRDDYAPFPMEEVHHITVQLLDAISYIHKCGLTHTDLKPENILLDDSSCFVKNAKRNLRHTKITVIDFGSATFDSEHHSKIVSTRHYRAPEVILEMGWGAPCDIWSVGCILVELITGSVLFQTHDNMEHLAMMEKTLGSFPRAFVRKSTRRSFFSDNNTLRWPELARDAESKSYVSDSVYPLKELVNTDLTPLHSKFYQLVIALLQFSPRERSTAAEAQQTPFVQEFDANAHAAYLSTRAEALAAEGLALQEY